MFGAPGLEFESDLPGARPYYFTETFASSLELPGTSQFGMGGFIDLPPGLRTFRVKDSGDVVASFQAPIKVGYATNVYVAPSPERGW